MSAVTVSPSATTRAAALPAPASNAPLIPSAISHAVLLLHGQPGGAADWDGVVARLAGHADPLAIDRPGWDGRHRACDLAGNGRAALTALDAHRVARATVVGHSLGGAIAAWLAVHHPDRVSGLVLVAPAANLRALDALDRWLAAPVLAELAAAAAMGGLGLALSIERLRTRLAAAAGVSGGYLLRTRRALLGPAAWRSYAIEQRALVHDLPALDPGLETIAAPTTILAGDRDRVVSPDAARRLAEQIPRARLVFREGAGHLLPQREPAFVAEQILAALSEAEGSTLAGR
jgi:pimeloyl-ACP methyl ester carboxylesterase